MWIALVTGLIGSGVTITALLAHKRAEMRAFIQNVQASVEGNAQAQNAIAEQAVQMRQRLEAFGVQHTGQVVERTAHQYIAETYGLTAQRLTKLSLLASRLGS